MKKALFLMCWIGIVVMISGCKDDGGSSGGGGDYPDVSFVLNESTGNVVCYNADKNVITTEQKCTWACAYYLSTPKWVQLTFDETLVCVDSGIDAEGKVTQTCTNEVGLVNTKIKPCYWQP